jgi:hypothetical protein
MFAWSQLDFSATSGFILCGVFKKVSIFMIKILHNIYYIAGLSKNISVQSFHNLTKEMPNKTILRRTAL